MMDADDPIHLACEFLLPEAPHRLEQLVDMNDLLRAADRSNAWPTHLVAFASNGCGDYFAYDLRTSPPEIVYMDPYRTVEENLTSDDRLVFESFDAWYASRLAPDEIS